MRPLESSHPPRKATTLYHAINLGSLKARTRKYTEMLQTLSVQADFESYKAMTHDMLEAKDKQIERLREESTKLQRRPSYGDVPRPSHPDKAPNDEVRQHVRIGCPCFCNLDDLTVCRSLFLMTDSRLWAFTLGLR